MKKGLLLAIILLSFGVQKAEAAATVVTWNPSDKGSAWTLTNGNLTATSNSTSMGVRGTIGKSSGKWYFELKNDSFGYQSIGVANATADVSAATPVTNNWVYYSSTGHKFGDGADTAYGATWTTNDVIGIALDMDNGTIGFYKNNVFQGTAFTGLSGTLYPVLWENASVSVSTVNFGATAFTYEPPAGYQALGASMSSECTGGTITRTGGRTIHTFTTGGTLTCTGSGTADYLVVAGGGGGGGAPGSGYNGGGGGAGAMRTGTLAVGAQAYSITVGDGGGGGANGSQGTDGSSSIFSTITSSGGGGGGTGIYGGYAAEANGRNGGSGGGGGGVASGTQPAGGTGTTGGNNGGAGSSINSAFGGGGGGAGGVGVSGTAYPAAGGSGSSSSISGSSVTYSTGGSVSATQSTGAANTGNGGDGRNGYIGTGSGLAGGSGIIIVSYLTPNSCTGGTITYSGSYTIHTFTSGGFFTCFVNRSVDYLVVAGGGGGGDEIISGGSAGGGGAGAVRTGTLSVTAQAYTVTVGSGGNGATNNSGAAGTSGGDSVFSSITSTGGGGGAGYSAGAKNGGSGGGGSALHITGGSGTTGGNSGGNALNSSSDGGGGGGGAGAIGGNATLSNAGTGGVGVSSSISGSAVFYGGGGGGGASLGAAAGSGGNGGGGAGSTTGAPVNGTANTGGGGGGNASGSVSAGGAGGSGIVIVRYLTVLPGAAVQAPSYAKYKFFGGYIKFKGGATKYSVSGPSDPFLSKVVLAMHMDGTNGSTTFTDQRGHAVTANGSAAISTTQSKFGGASGYFPGTLNTDYLSTPDSTDFEFAGDYTIEGWYYNTSTPGASNFMPIINKGYTVMAGSNYWSFGLTDTNYYFYTGNGTNTGYWNYSTIALNTWTHFAITRTGGNTYFFINGTLISTVSNTTYPFLAGSLGVNSSPLRISDPNGQGGSVRNFQGYLDDLRITKGVARYTATFTPPTRAFPNQ